MSDISRRDFVKTTVGTAIGATLTPATLAAADYRILDPHVHVWKHDPEFPFAQGQNVPDRDATPATLLGLMKSNGVSKTVLIQVIHYRYDNRFLAHTLKQYPKMFKGVCRVDPLAPAAPDQLSQLTEQGFSGVRLSPGPGPVGDWIKRPLMPPLWKRCAELKVPMTVLAPVERMPEVAKLMEKLPEMTVVIDHMADCPVSQPQELEKLIALKRFPNVFVKISHTWSLSRQPYPWLDSQELVKRLHAAFGPQRLMWATDWPILESVAKYPQALTVVRDDMKFLNADDKSWMLSKTIERVWPFPA